MPFNNPAYSAEIARRLKEKETANRAKFDKEYIQKQKRYIRSLEQMNNLLSNDNRALRNAGTNSSIIRTKKLRNTMRKYKSQLSMKEYAMFKIGKNIKR
tara:strand:+ start:2949 stop:3245 length:297 start_codon:yes stop_codon:yes gene_type:complete